VLNDLSLAVEEGRIVAILGRNGAGKSSLLKVIAGALPLWSGSMSIDGNDITRMDVGQRIAAGIAYVPQGNRVFTELTVIDNLLIRGRTVGEKIAKSAIVEQACAQFPPLKPLLAKRAGLLSGGERQMLAMAGAMLLSPRLMLLDEPSLGLSEAFRSRMFRTVLNLRECRQLAILVVEQQVSEVMSIADEFCVIREGRLWKHGSPDELGSDEARREVLL
jgi:branched-chain amino acid transport system ATP-binding protein